MLLPSTILSVVSLTTLMVLPLESSTARGKSELNARHFPQGRRTDLLFRWINGTTGRRSDVPHNFLYPHLDNKNLLVLTDHLVKRVLVESVHCCTADVHYLILNFAEMAERSVSSISRTRRSIWMFPRRFSPLALNASSSFLVVRVAHP